MKYIFFTIVIYALIPATLAGFVMSFESFEFAFIDLLILIVFAPFPSTILWIIFNITHIFNRKKALAKRTPSLSTGIASVYSQKISFRFFNFVFANLPTLRNFCKKQSLVFDDYYNQVTVSTDIEHSWDSTSSIDSNDYWRRNDIYYSPGYRSLSCNVHNNNRH